MTKKILFSVLGANTLGHATRVHAILKNLKNRAIYKVIASDSAYNYLKQKGYRPIKIESIGFGKKRFAFDMSASLIKNLDYPVQMTKNYVQISSIIDDFEPDIVFSDSEPSSFLVALSKNQRIYSLNNYPITVDESKRVSLNKSMRNQLSMIKRVVEFVIKNSKKVFVPCFYKPKTYIRKIEYVGLILRKELGPVQEKDYYLVTLGGSGFSEEALHILFKILPEFKNKNFVVSTNNLFRNKMKRKNMVLYPFISENYIKHSKAVITLAGYSTISESIGYKRPLLMLPIENHVEQFLNAHLVKRMGFGDYVPPRKALEPGLIREKLSAFFEDEQKYQKNLDRANVMSNGAEEICKKLIQ